MRGEFYTPFHLSVCMAQMIIPDGEQFPKDRPLSFLEPCCGSGGMILAAAKVLHERDIPVQCMRWRAADLNHLSADMTFINTTLWGIPCEVFCGNSLTDPNYENSQRRENMFFWLAHPYAGGQRVEAAVPELVSAGQYAMEFGPLEASA
jgi:type I restriction-modification system DNA methylase subunit